MSNLGDSKLFTEDQQSFWNAVQDGNVEVVRQLLTETPSLAAKNFDPDGSDEDFFPLAPASSMGHYEIARLLLDHGADINKPNQYGGYCAIQRAVEGGHYRLAHLLLDRGAVVDAHPEANQSMIQRLHNAVVADGVPASLVRHGYRKYLAPEKSNADLPDDFRLEEQAESVQLFARVLSLGAHCEFAPLIRHYHTDIMEELFRHVPEESGRIWHLASWYGYPDVLDSYMEMCEEHLTPEDSMDAIDAASISHNRDGSYADYRRLIETQLKRLVELDALEQFKSKFNAIYRVADSYCWHSNYGYWAGVSKSEDACDLAQLFLDFGFDIDQRDPATNLTPLAKAVLRGQPVPNWTTFIKFLIDSGAGLCSDDPDETNPLTIANHESFYDKRTPAERREVIALLEQASNR